MRPRRPQPVQCQRCCRYEHKTVTRELEEQCARYGAPHPRAQYNVKRARCLLCSAADPAAQPRCPTWQQERRTLEDCTKSARPHFTTRGLGCSAQECPCYVQRQHPSGPLLCGRFWGISFAKCEPTLREIFGNRDITSYSPCCAGLPASWQRHPSALRSSTGHATRTHLSWRVGIVNWRPR